MWRNRLVMTMDATSGIPAFLLKNKPLDIIPDLVTKPTVTEQSEEPDAILCGNCFQTITNISERMTVQGAHQHAFANPQGVIFEIGCYRRADGCRYSGIPTSEWSWFRGFSWRFAICGKCLLQVGWFFSSKSDVGFNGLIINRLVFPS